MFIRKQHVRNARNDIFYDAVSSMNYHAIEKTYCSIVKPVLSDHIKQNIFLAFQTGGYLLLHESSAESSCTPFIQQ